MSGRRKGELTASAIDRAWPYQVVLDADYVSRNFDALLQRTADLSAAPRNHGYFRDGRYWVVYCFASDEHAAAFHAEFSGQRITPDDRPRWPAKPSPNERRRARATARKADT